MAKGLSADDYRSTLDKCVLIAGLVAEMPLTSALNTAHAALDVGPILYPSEWIKGSQNAEDAIALLEPLVAFQNAALKLRERYGQAHPAARGADAQEGT